MSSRRSAKSIAEVIRKTSRFYDGSAAFLSFATTHWLASISMLTYLKKGNMLMFRTPKKAPFVFSFCLLTVPVAMQAQAKKDPPQNPSTYMHVSAPLAQSVLIRVKAQHDDIVKLGLHAVPPGESDNVIIANIAPEKIGKKSSPADMEKLAQNKPIAVALNKSETFDLLIPITDASGGDLDQGFVVMEVPFSKAANEEEALKIGVRIRDEVQSQIPSRAAMYQQ
jgi:hypothetical protein